MQALAASCEELRARTGNTPLDRVFVIAGEIFELKAELNSEKKDRKKEAVKKVIASMTVGKDVR